MNTDSRLYFCGDDLIHRGIYAQNIKRIIKYCHTFPKNNDNSSFVIGIDAPWGSGKTFFAQMLLSYLEGKWEKPNLDGGEIIKAKHGTGTDTPSEDKDIFPVVYYDAWKNDFWNNAFEPLFDNLIRSTPVWSKAEEKDILDLLKSTGKIIAYGVKGIVSKKVEDNFDPGAIDDINKEIGEMWRNAKDIDYQTKETFPEYSAFKDAIELLKKYLSKVVEKDKKLIIIIDELDRCKPTFAVQTLEIVKHLFNVEGLVFIFALDINQLSHSVKVVYGNGFDAIGYLERFFNYLTILPQGRLSSTEQSILFINKMGLQGVYSKFDDNIIQRFFHITEMFGLSLREVKTVLSAYSVLLETVLAQYSEYADALIFYFYFLCMKYKYPVLFSDGVFKNKSYDVARFIQENKIPFIDCEDSSYSDLCTKIEDNKKIRDSKYHILKKGKREFFPNYSKHGDTIMEVVDNEIITVEGGKIALENDISLSLLLYLPDIQRFEEILNYGVLEFVFRQLEMCDFIHA